jgi:hypothetical protein
MVTLNEYAQFASIVYAKTSLNKLPIPTGWVEQPGDGVRSCINTYA